MNPETDADQLWRSRYGSAFGRGLRIMDTLSRHLLITVMAILVTLVVTQVFCRYVLAESIDAAYEISRLCFVWVIFLAIPHGLRSGAHVGIDIFINLAPRPVRQAAFRITSAIGAALMALVAVQAVQVAHTSWDQLLPTVSASYGLFYVAVVISAVHCCLHFVRLASLGEDVVNFGRGA